jgi:UDP-N-acetylglucosamine 2-epimerase (non-hydrolysing)
VVYGDTNSTIAGTLAAAKLRVPVAHVEAGLRSFNRAMPEELNRVVTDHLSDLLFAPTDTAMGNLVDEGLGDRAHLVGDVMVDALRSIEVGPPPQWLEPGQALLATIHRAENTDHPERLRQVLDALARSHRPVHLLAHPRLRARASEFGLDGALNAGSLVTRDPLPYSQLIGALTASAGVLTDSGGLQKEAFILRVPCVTLRSETEWPETLDGSWNVLAGDRLEDVPSLAERTPSSVQGQPFGDGAAATRVVEMLTSATPAEAVPERLPA